eukprot:comp20945_c0_seq1/m.27998 comp20945_c0_seq1/g.27998  ORF comp20945_c0_seq1/g.27998 comp20945_c0_seq1/m.27998 type:complete len:265 (-) comp20945_c0_seq1:60-854(-)
MASTSAEVPTSPPAQEEAGVSSSVPSADASTYEQIKKQQEDRLAAQPHQVRLLAQTQQVIELQTIIRDKEVSRGDFIFYSLRLIRLLVEEGLNQLPYEDATVITPTGAEYHGVGWLGRICGVSIMRAGEAMEQALRECCRNIRIGKILIQKDPQHEDSEERKLYYAKFPSDIDRRYVFLLDPLLATGGTVLKAIEVLLDYGVREDHILFLTLFASPEGIKNLTDKYPKVTIVTTHIDDGLDAQGYIVPGIGDFGERYFTADIRI